MKNSNRSAALRQPLRARKSTKTAPVATGPIFPRARLYQGEDGEPAEFGELPFVSKQRGPRYAWAVPPCDDYGMTCKIGEAYGAHFAQYLRENHESGAAVGSLASIIKAIDFAAPSPLHGYWVGFLSYIEHLAFAEATRRDVISDIKRFGRQAEFLAANACKRAEGRSHE